MSESSWIDISIPLTDGMVHWPGDPPVSIKRVKDMAGGATANLSMISMGTHSGTHVDAPLHFIDGGNGVDTMPLETLVGKARVIAIRDAESIKPEELKEHRIRRGERILLKTRNSSRLWQRKEFAEDFVYLSDDAAKFLAARGVRAIGVDYLSVGSYRDGGDTHRALLGGGVWIIEGINLSAVAPGSYYLVCLPLRIVGGDGAPARAILRPLPSGGRV